MKADGSRTLLSNSSFETCQHLTIHAWLAWLFGSQVVVWWWWCWWWTAVCGNTAQHNRNHQTQHRTNGYYVGRPMHWLPPARPPAAGPGYSGLACPSGTCRLFPSRHAEAWTTSSKLARHRPLPHQKPGLDVPSDCGACWNIYGWHRGWNFICIYCVIVVSIVYKCVCIMGLGSRV